jgi:hypothetical protein
MSAMMADLRRVLVLVAIGACGSASPAPATAAAPPRVDCDQVMSRGLARAVDPTLSENTFTPSTEVIAPGDRVENAKRIAGNAFIKPPRNVQAHLRRGQWVTSFKLCLDEQGVVTSLDLTQTSGLFGWEHRICEEARDWRYTPFRLNGKAMAACTLVTFVYTQR